MTTSNTQNDCATAKELWIYAFRTNQKFTLCTNPLKREHLEDFIQYFNAANRYDHKETERFRRFSYEELIKRDKLNLDSFWLPIKNWRVRRICLRQMSWQKATSEISALPGTIQCHRRRSGKS